MVGKALEIARPIRCAGPSVAETALAVDMFVRLWRAAEANNLVA